MMTNETIQVILEAPIPQGSLSIIDFIPGILSSLIGAFVGVFSAIHLFKRQQRRDQKRIDEKISDENFEAGNKALFCMFCQANAILHLLTQIDKYKDDSERWIKMPIQGTNYETTPTINFDSLSFLLKKPLSPNALATIYGAQTSFDQAMYVEQKRNDLRAKFTDYAVNNDAQRIQIHEKDLISYTDALFSSAEKAQNQLVSGRDHLVDALQKLYPDRDSITFVKNK